MMRRLGITAVTLALLTIAVPGQPTSAESAAPKTASPRTLASTAQRGAVLGKRVIGHSVRDRAITAWHLGQPGKPTVVLLAAMHGNEDAPSQILTSLRDGRQINGVNLWVVPSYNPDGRAADTRRNAHGVDLNRNFPYRWKDLDGNYESGPKPASEPETRAMMRFLSDIRPKWILSFHQPLHGVDLDTKRPRFAHRVARHLDLPPKRFTCGGVCHGTLTMWFNHRFRGTALTVEYGEHPPRRLMRVRAPRQVLSIFGAWRGRFAFGQA